MPKSHGPDAGAKLKRCVASIEARNEKLRASHSRGPRGGGITRDPKAACAASIFGKKNPAPENAWRRRTIQLPEDLVEVLDQWHGGIRTDVYGLASAARNDLVSVSMIDAAQFELEATDKKLREHSRDVSDEDLESIEAAIGYLGEVRENWRRHALSDREVEETLHHPPFYDRRDYALDEDTENDVSRHL